MPGGMNCRFPGENMTPPEGFAPPGMPGGNMTPPGGFNPFGG
jgi:hypothetical protein